MKQKKGKRYFSPLLKEARTTIYHKDSLKNGLQS